MSDLRRKNGPVAGRLRIALLASIVTVTCGCATMEPSELPPDELRRQLASGEVVSQGQHVAITTADGQRQELQVTDVSKEYVLGSVAIVSEGTTMDVDTLEPVQVVEQEQISIPIDRIVAVEIREATPAGKAAGAAGAVAAVGAFWYFMWLLPALIVGAAL
jgi:hypothetical protein